MPLIEIRQLSTHVKLGLWRIDESIEGAPRQRERQAVLSLLHAMTGDETLTIGHEPSGKPFIDPFHGNISVSHTRGYAALLLSDGRERLGVDIEYRSDRVERIASRFIRTDEDAPATADKLLIWSAKEAVYKLYSEDHLMFFDMRTQRFSSLGNISEKGVGLLHMENLGRNEVVDVHYEFTDDYVLTFAFLPA